MKGLQAKYITEDTSPIGVKIYLTTFMVSSQNSNPLRKTHFQGNQQLIRESTCK